MAKDFIISEGKTFDEALKRGLEKLKSDIEKVEVEVLEEKKNTIFRKGYVKLKINKRENLFSEEKKQEQVQPPETKSSSLVADNNYFKLKYLPDGVYIQIIQFDAKDVKDKIKSIIDYLDKKLVKDYDVDIIKKSLQDNIVTPIKIAPYQEEIKIDEDVYIEITKDKLEAYITLLQGDGGRKLNFEYINEKLKQSGIVYGIDIEKLKEIINSKCYGTKFLIARGKKPQNGENGRIIYYFDTQKDSKPQILEDGTVDFKHLNLINNVKKGQLLAEIVPPTEGIPGKNVLGEEISALNGKTVRIIKGKNVYDEEGLKFYSDIDGQVFLKDGKLQVSEIYEIGDVDHSTGNIDFNGKVIIKGNVKSGFTVKAQGDIEVNGVVEGATLICEGNIILNRGVQGNNQAYLKCNGDLVSKYIENATIKSGGTVQADSILHSNVVAKGKVIAMGKKGLIAGGQVRATEEISAKTIGSHMGTITILEVGIDPDEKFKYEGLKKEIDETKKNLNNLRKTIELLTKLKKNNKLDKTKEEIFIKSIKTYEYLNNKYQQLLTRLKLIEENIKRISTGKIHVSNKMYPGTKVTILNSSKHIYDELTHSTLYKKDGDIVIGTYEK